MKRIILKLLKWIMIVFIIFILFIVGLRILHTHNNSIKIKKVEEKLKEFRMLKNDWREFNFSDIPGEPPYFGYSKYQHNALARYKIQKIQVYNDIAFVTGDDRNEVEIISPTEDIGTKKIDERLQAYVFRSKDGGKTFDKQNFGQGTAYGVRKINNDLYLTIGAHINKTKSTLLKSNDNGDTWKNIPYIPWVVLNKDILIEGYDGDEQITYDGGKTWSKVSKNLKTYLNKFPKYYRPIPYKNKLVKLQDRKLIFFDIEADKEEIIPLNVPKGKIIDNNESLHSDNETGELSVALFQDIVGNPRTVQGSIWFPLENKEVILDKKLPKPVFLKVHGKYIGGFTEVEGVFTHIWTLNKGETWNYELLPNYFWPQNISYGNGQIWMEVLLRGKKDMQNGSYLAIGTLKDY